MLLMVNTVKGPARIPPADKEKVIIYPTDKTIRKKHIYCRNCKKTSVTIYLNPPKRASIKKRSSKGMQKRDSHVFPTYQIRWSQLNVLMIINVDSSKVYLINFISPYALRNSYTTLRTHA